MANHVTIGLVMGWPTVGVGGLMGWLTGKVPVILLVSRQWDWWTNGSADKASSSNYQLANSGIGGLMGQLTGQVEVTTSQLTVGW